jgi:hypothetical protein
VGLKGLLEWFNQAELRLMDIVHATQEDWDRYVGLKWRTFDRWYRENREDPDAEDLYQYMLSSQASYLGYMRPLCGWGAFVLRPSDL